MTNLRVLVQYGPVAETNMQNLSANLQQKYTKVSLSYDYKNQKFIVLNSHELDDKDLQELFDRIPFITFAPKIDERRDEEGNKVIRLIDVSKTYADLGRNELLIRSNL